MNLTKEEIKSIRAYVGDFQEPTSVNVCGKPIIGIIILSHGRRKLHENGYPYIKIIGIGGEYKCSAYQRNGEYYDLGWHDHIYTTVITNMDSFGKNIFHIFPSFKQRWYISNRIMSLSTFRISRDSISGIVVKEERKS